MSYLRTFYPQKNAFESSLYFKRGEEGFVDIFGLSGDSQSLDFRVENDLVKINNTFLSSLDENGETSFLICGDSGIVTVWKDDEPLMIPFSSGYNFSSVFCNSLSSGSFKETLFGSQPLLSLSLSGWDNTLKSGNLFLANGGDYSLLIDSIDTLFNYVYISGFPSSIPSGGTGIIPIFYKTSVPLSGQETFSFETNAGLYSFDQSFDLSPPSTSSGLNILFDNFMGSPSGSYNFFIENLGNTSVSAEIFFDFYERAPYQIETGNAIYYTPSGNINVDYEDGGFFKTEIGTGAITSSISQDLSWSSAYWLEYDTLFTGMGGRLNASGIQRQSGSDLIRFYPTGELLFDYCIPTTSIISGFEFTSFATGQVTGQVGPGSGVYHFYEWLVGPAATGTTYSGGTYVPVDPLTLFSGFLDFIAPLSAYYSGDVTSNLYRNILVYEGRGEFSEFWSAEYYDPASGTIPLVLRESGLGNTGVYYDIPASSVTSGKLTYSSDYYSPIFQSLMFRVTNRSSINDSIYISN